MMDVKDLLRDSWDTVKDIARLPVRTAKVTWRQAFKLFEKSLGTAILERVAGFIVLALIVAALVVLIGLSYDILRAVK